MKHNHVFNILLLSISMLICSLSFAQNFSLNQDNEKLQLTDILVLSERQSEQYSVNDVAKIPNAGWQRHAISNGRFELPGGISWVQIKLRNEHGQLKNFYLTLKNHFQIAEVDFFYQFRNFKIQSIETTLSQANFYYGNVQLAARSDLTLYMRISSDNSLIHNVEIMDALPFEQTLSKFEFYNGAAIGGMVFLSLIFWIIYIGSREKLVSVLAAYFTLRTMLLSTFLGGNLFYLFEQNQSFRGFEMPILASLSSFFYIYFALILFQLKSTSPKLFKITRWVMWSTLLYLPIGLFLSVSTNMILTATLMISVTAFLLGLGLYQVKQKKKISILFSMVIFLHLLFSCIIVCLEYLEIFLFAHREFIQIVSFWINSLLIIMLVSRLYYFVVKEKQSAQLEALEHAVSSKKAQEKLLKLQEENQEELEQRVQERTLELNIALNELEELNIELEQKNTTDELTALHNRRFYDQKILAEYRRSKRNLTPLSLVILDIDHFKSVNDRYGHLAGDQCLSWVGQIIKQNLKRSTDLACRYGGEEFVLILPDTEQVGAFALAESIRDAIEKFEFIYQKHQIPLTISCGVSTYLQQDNITPKEIFLAADKALYVAKNSGRNQVKQNEILSDLFIPE